MTKKDYWSEDEGTPFVVAMALSSGSKQKHWKKEAKEWLKKNKDGKEFYGRLKVKDKKFLDKALGMEDE